MRRSTPNIAKSYTYRGFFSRVTAMISVFTLVIVISFVALFNHINKQNSGPNAEIISNVLQNYPVTIDNLYIDKINNVMEAIFSEPVLIGYAFSTENYPPTPEMYSHIPSAMTKLCEENPFIEDICFYTSTIDDYITPKTIGMREHPDDAHYSDMIYAYNSNTIKTNQIYLGEDAKHLTFTFVWDNNIYFCMDMTTLSGQSHTTLFIKLDQENLSDYIFKEIESIRKYGIKIYDYHGTLLFDNNLSSKNNSEYLLSTLSKLNEHYTYTGNQYYIYNTSKFLGWQYVYEISRSFMSGLSRSIYIYLGILAVIIPLLILVLSYVLDKYLIAPLYNENKLLKQMVNNLSKEAVSQAFSQILFGQNYSENSIRLTLQHTNLGFSEKGVYCTGIIDYVDQTPLSPEQRFTLLNLITDTLDKFKLKYPCHAHTGTVDDTSFYIILAFSQDTSVAKGKLMINELDKQLQYVFRTTKRKILCSFGHMYHSIFDVGFSYNEALRSRKVVIIQDSSLGENLDSQSNISSAVGISEVEISENSAAPSETVVQVDPAKLERRAEQIASSLFKEQTANVDSLINRTIGEIMSLDKKERTQYIKQFMSTLVEDMISYPFVNPDLLTDIPSTFPGLTTSTDSVEVRILLKEAISTLCKDFSDSLKKQRNPYITAAQSYIHDHYKNSELSLEEIADALKIAPNYLSTLFTKSLGKKLFEYVTEYRLNKSIEMLVSTNLSINEISEKNGFGSSRNYIRIFKKYKDTTPGAYRKSQLGHAPATTQEEKNE